MSIGPFLDKLGLTDLGLVLGLSVLVYFARRRKKGLPLSLIVVFVGTLLLASALILFGSGIVAPLPSRARTWLDLTTYLGVSFVLLKLVDLLVIDDHLIDRKGAYIPVVLGRLIVLVAMSVARLS